MNDTAPFVIKVTVFTLATILIIMLLPMLWGLYDHRVDNDKIFAIIGPAFQTIVGAFVGVISTLIATGNKK